MDKAPLTIYTSTQCDLSLYQVSSKSPEGTSRGVVKTKYFTKKTISPGGITPSKIIGQGSPYKMHIYTM
jgi:hypothetical protein